MLMLTHFSSRFVEEHSHEMKEEDDVDDEDLMHTQRLQKEAQQEIERLNSQCIVRCAADFMSVRFAKNNKIIIEKELALTESKKCHFLHDLPYLKLVANE